MKTVLVTGPIGSGKSEVCRYLSSKSYPVYDCDSRTKALYSTIPGLKARIEQAIQTDWAHIAVIFSDDTKRSILESIVYPYVKDDLESWKAEQKAEIVFIESAIALDKQFFDGTYDYVLMVEAAYSTRVARNQSAAQRDRLQSFERRVPDYTITNESTIEVLHRNIDKILCRLI